MSEIRDLLEKLDQIDERQQWDSLDAVIDQYATPNMTVDDLRAMERAAINVREVGDGGFWSNLRAAGRSLVSNKHFRVNYVLYHAGEKLGLSHGLIGSDGKLRTLNGSQYGVERLFKNDPGHRNIVLAQAKLNLLPSRVSNLFQIPNGGGNATRTPTRTGHLQSGNPNDIAWMNFAGRDEKPYIDIERRGEYVRIRGDAENLSTAFPNATIMKADGSGPLNPADNSAASANAAGNLPRDRERDGSNPGGTTTVVEPTAAAADALARTGDEYKNSLDDFVAPGANQGGLANNPEAVGAIKELNTRLSNLGFTNVQADSEEYSAATRQAVRDFQTAFNRMYQATYPDQATAPDIEPNIDIDGDFGPDTLNALKQVEQLFSTIERLVAANSTENSSIQYKSSISKMLEETFIFEELNSAQLGELTGSIIAVDKFVGAAGENFALSDARKQMLINARTLLNDWVKDMSAEPAPNIVSMSNGSITPVGSSSNPEVTGNDREEAWEAILNNDLPEGWPEGYELWKNRDENEWYVLPPGDNATKSETFDNVQSALDWANEHKGGGEQTAAPSREATLIARILNDGIEDGVFRIDREQVVDGLSRVADNSPDEWEDVVTAYKQEYDEDLIDILRTALNRNLFFIPQFAEQMQRINAEHFIPVNPRQLDISGAVRTRIFGENNSKYVFRDTGDRATRGWYYTPEGANTATFDWGERNGNELTGTFGENSTWKLTVNSINDITLQMGEQIISNVIINSPRADRSIRIKGDFTNSQGEQRTNAFFTFPMNEELRPIADALIYAYENMLEGA